MHSAIIALVWFAVPALAFAHHSSAVFDPSRTLTLQGVVKEFRWTNPHASILLLAAGDGGWTREEWNIETTSPQALARAGWKPDTLKPGDAVSVVVHPMRDNTRGGLLVSARGPHGKLIDVPPPPVKAQTLSLHFADASCAPRIETTIIEPSASAETRPVKLGESTIFVRRDALVTTKDIVEIGVRGDDFDTLILLKYEPGAAATLQAMTTNRDGLKLAFVVNDDVWLAFKWTGPYGIDPSGSQVSLRTGGVRAERLMESLRHCMDAQAR